MSVAVQVEVWYPKNQFPEASESALRARIIDILRDCDFGHLSGIGCSAETMTFTYMVKDESTARQLLDECMGKVAPKFRYTLTALENNPPSAQHSADY